jgi:FkbM family methyltransferase
MSSKNLLFDIGANRGDATVAGLEKGYKKIVSVETAPKMYSLLLRTFAYHSEVLPLKFAISDSNNEIVEFYECVEDGLSTTEKAWLTDPSMPYHGKEFRTVRAVTCTLDFLIEQYGNPDLVKIDVEGAESQVLAGLTLKPKNLAFEWTIETLDQHIEQLRRLKEVNGYTEYALQYITHHLDQPKEYRSLKDPEDLRSWIEETAELWVGGEWLRQGRLRPTADVGMIWVK